MVYFSLGMLLPNLLRSYLVALQSAVRCTIVETPLSQSPTAAHWIPRLEDVFGSSVYDAAATPVTSAVEIHHADWLKSPWRHKFFLQLSQTSLARFELGMERCMYCWKVFVFTLKMLWFEFIIQRVMTYICGACLAFSYGNKSKART